MGCGGHYAVVRLVQAGGMERSGQPGQKFWVELAQLCN